MFPYGNACCCPPIISISTTDSSVEYAYLCSFETLAGTPGNSCPPGTVAEGACVIHPPTALDIQRYKDDCTALTNTLNEHTRPMAMGIIAPRGRCWAGVKTAVIPYSEPNPTDTYGPSEWMLGGAATQSPQSRLFLTDLQTMFQKLYAKHYPPGTDKTESAICHLDIDNSGSIQLSEWQVGALTNFKAWLIAEYPRVIYRETMIRNYIVDTERWINRLRLEYIKICEGG